MKLNFKLKPTITLAKASIMSGLIGDKLNNQPLKDISSNTAVFVPVTANLAGMGMTMNLIKKIK